MLEDYNGLEQMYFGLAVVGVFIFILSLILQFFGGDSGLDGDISEGLSGSDVSFKLLSVGGLSNFIGMFGMVGLAAYRGSGASAEVSLVVAAVVAFLSFKAFQAVFSAFKKLQSNGKVKTKKGDPK